MSFIVELAWFLGAFGVVRVLSDAYGYPYKERGVHRAVWAQLIVVALSFGYVWMMFEVPFFDDVFTKGIDHPWWHGFAAVPLIGAGMVMAFAPFVLSGCLLFGIHTESWDRDEERRIKDEREKAEMELTRAKWQLKHKTPWRSIPVVERLVTEGQWRTLSKAGLIHLLYRQRKTDPELDRLWPAEGEQL